MNNSTSSFDFLGKTLRDGDTVTLRVIRRSVYPSPSASLTESEKVFTVEGDRHLIAAGKVYRAFEICGDNLLRSGGMGQTPMMFEAVEVLEVSAK